MYLTRPQICERLLQQMLYNQHRDMLWELVSDSFNIAISREVEDNCMTIFDVVEAIKVELIQVPEIEEEGEADD